LQIHVFARVDSLSLTFGALCHRVHDLIIQWSTHIASWNTRASD